MINLRKRQFAAIIGVIVAAIVAAVFYSQVNPTSSRWMPRCIFRSLTGYDCPGCGFQRALYSVLHGDFAAAWQLNPFLFFIIPVGLCYLVVELSGRPLTGLRRAMFSPTMLWALISVTIVWWIVRNIS